MLILIEIKLSNVFASIFFDFWFESYLVNSINVNAWQNKRQAEKQTNNNKILFFF